MLGQRKPKGVVPSPSVSSISRFPKLIPFWKLVDPELPLVWFAKQPIVSLKEKISNKLPRTAAT